MVPFWFFSEIPPESHKAIRAVSFFTQITRYKMTAKAAATLTAEWQGRDPKDWIQDLIDSLPVDLLAGITGNVVQAKEATFTETTGAGVYTASIALPAGATLVDVIINGVALWNATTSATLIVGDGTDPDGYYTAVNLKATDLLAGESLSFALAGGKAGAYIANSQVSPRYSATARNIIGEVTTVGAAGNAGRTRMTVLYTVSTVQTAASKA